MKQVYKVDVLPLGLLIGIVFTLFFAIESMHPYFFFQDDNRIYFYPHIVHNVRAILNGELAFFNFHQYLGTTSLACSEPAVLYPPYYLGYFLSILLTGDSFATIECIALFHLILAAAGFYRLMRFFDMKTVSCVYGGITWAFSGVVVIIGNSWIHYSGYAVFLPWVMLYAVRFCRWRKFSDFLILSLLRCLACTLGQPQLFAYMVVFEFILATGYLLIIDKAYTQKSGSPKNTDSTVTTILYYLMSFPVSLALAAPILLPTLHQASLSAGRSVPLEWDEYLSLSYNLKLWLHGLFTPLDHIVEQDWTGQGILSHIGYLALIFVVLAWGGCRENRRFVLFLTAVAVFALCWSSDTVVTSLIYHVPVFNKFRWPFRLAYFTSFFLTMVAVFGCDHFVSYLDRCNFRSRLVTAVSVSIVMIQAVNVCVLYSATPQPMFSRHYDQVPFNEPLKDRLVGGRIVSIGLVPPEEGSKAIHGYSLPQMGFNYATLWGLQYFAGYEVLVAKENLEATLKLEGRSVCNVIPGTKLNIPEIAPLDYFRNWGVRWYVIDKKVPLIPTDQLKLLYSDKFRNVLEDSRALPLVFWRDGNGTASYQFRTNSIEIKTVRQTEGDLLVNVLANRYFSANIDGVDTSLRRTDDGKMVVTVPQGEHKVEIRYHERDFTKGIAVALFTLLGLGICGYVLKRKQENHVDG